MSVSSDDVLLSGKGGFWFSNDHGFDSWFSGFGAYNPFAQSGIVFKDEHILKGSDHKIAIIHYNETDINNLNLYNKVLAEELIIYFSKHTKITGSLKLDNSAKVRLVAPHGVTIDAADFTDLNVIISTHNLEELQKLLVSKGEGQESSKAIAESDSVIEVNDAKAGSLWIEACRMVFGGWNVINSFGAGLACSNFINAYSFRALENSMLSSTSIDIENHGNNLGVKLEGDMSARIIKIAGGEELDLGGDIRGSKIDIGAKSVKIGENATVHGASYKRADGVVVGPGKLRVYGDNGLFAPSSRIYFQLADIIEYLGKEQANRTERNHSDYSCYMGGICLNKDFSWLLGDDRYEVPGNATSNLLSNNNMAVLSSLSGLPLISLEFESSLELGGNIEGESGVGIIGQVILKLDEDSKVTTKNGPIKLTGQETLVSGELSSGYINIEAKDLTLNSDKIKSENVHIETDNFKNKKSINSKELCINVSDKFENNNAGIIEFKSGSISASELINLGKIKADYGKFEAVNKINNQGEMNNLSSDPQASLHLIIEAGNITSLGSILANNQVRIEAKNGEIIVESIIVGKGNIYLIGKKVDSKNLLAQGVMARGQEWFIDNIVAQSIDYTNERGNELLIITGKIETDYLSIKAFHLGFDVNSKIAIKHLVANLGGGLYQLSGNKANIIGDLYQRGGNLHLYPDSYLLIDQELDLDSPEHSFNTRGNLIVNKKAIIKIKNFEHTKDHHIQFNIAQIEAGGAIYNAGSISALQNITLTAFGQINNAQLITSEHGNIYLKSGADIVNIDGSQGAKIQAPQGKISLVAKGNIYSDNLESVSVYTKSNEYHNYALLATKDDFEMNTTFYYNGPKGKIAVGGIWQLVDSADMSAKRLVLHVENNAWSAGKGIYFEGKEWIQHTKLNLAGDLILILDNKFINYSNLIVGGKFHLSAKDSVINHGYVNILGETIIIAKHFFNQRLWDSMPADMYRIQHQIWSTPVHGDSETALHTAWRAITNYRATHNPEEFKVDVLKSSGEFYSDHITIIVEDRVANANGALIRANNGIILKGNEVANTQHHRRNGLGVYTNGFDIVPSIIEDTNGDIEIYANQKIYHKGSDVIARQGKIYEHAKYNIIHEAAAGAYDIRKVESAECINDPNNKVFNPFGGPRGCMHNVFSHLTFATYYFSRTANAYAKAGFYAHSESGNVIAVGAMIGSHGSVDLKGVGVIQTPVRVGNDYIGGVTIGNTVSFEAKDLYLAGIVQTTSNMYLKVSNVALIESLQHAYVQNYIWTKKYKEVIYNFVVSQVELIAGGGIELTCGVACNLKGAKLIANDDVVIDAPTINQDVAEIKAQNLIEQRKNKGLRGKSVINVGWETTCSIPTMIVSKNGKVTERGEYINIHGAHIEGKQGVEIEASKRLEATEHRYTEKITIQTKSKGPFAPKIDRAGIASKMGDSYVRVAEPARVGFGSWIWDSIKGAKSEGVLDLEGPLGLATDILSAQQTYGDLRLGGVSQDAALAQTMLSMLPSVNFNLGTIKTSVKVEKKNSIKTTVSGDEIIITAKEASFSGAEIKGKTSATVQVEENLEMKAATDSVKQDGEVVSHGPVMSVNFNGFTVAFAHSESEFTSFASHNIYSTITAPKGVIEVGGDLTLRGAYVKGEKVEVSVAKQLLVESVRDVNSAESESSSVSLGVSVNWAGQFAPSVSVSASDSMQNSELVHFISGISGADVKVVAETIKLKGAEIFGTEKLNVQGVVTTEDVEEIKESQSSHMGFSFDPIKGQGLTSINFGTSEKHDNGVVHSGVGAEATHENIDKGGYKISFLGNNVLVRGVKELYNWATTPTPIPANDQIPPMTKEVDPEQMNEKEESEEKSEPKTEKETKKKEEKIETKIASKAYATEYSEIDRAVDNLKITGINKEEIKQELHQFIKELRAADPARRKEIMADLLKQAKPEEKSILSKIDELLISKSHAFGPATPAVVAVSSCLSNPACSALLVGTAIMVYNKILTEVQKGSILSTPIHEDKGNIWSTPEHKEESSDRGFTPWDGSEYKDKGFTPIDFDTKTPGFEMPDSIDTSILMNEGWDDWAVDNYDKAMLHGKFGKFYQDSSAVSENGKRLWWSKDIAKHGGSEWKVFEETRDGLQWYKDADKHGNYIEGKHKGPTGMNINWKALREINIKK